VTLYLTTVHCISGADDQDLTGDLSLTKGVLYQLSYISLAKPELSAFSRQLSALTSQEAIPSPLRRSD
jgi:hypothetical protein